MSVFLYLQRPAEYHYSVTHTRFYLILCDFLQINLYYIIISNDHCVGCRLAAVDAVVSTYFILRVDWPYARNRHLELGQLENEAVGSQYVNNALLRSIFIGDMFHCTTTNLLFSFILVNKPQGIQAVDFCVSVSNRNILSFCFS